jgi:L-ascorbate metabolism protein UlaG (beta-lactamase superfamily)
VPSMRARSIASLIVVLVAAASCGRPSLRRYREYFTATELPSIVPGHEVRATFLGVSSIYFTDGETNLMIDGYLTRPDLLTNGLATKVEPNRTTIRSNLNRAGIVKLDAVLVAHTHFDHVLDAPVVAMMTGAKLIGSEETLMVARGLNFPEDRYVLVTPEQPMHFGDFTVTVLRTRHGPTFSFTGGRGQRPAEAPDLDAPLVPPVAWTSYPVGDCYLFHIAHPLGNVVVQPSAGYVEGQLDSFTADVVFLGIGRLGELGPSYRESYFDEIVGATGAKRIIPIHWDNYNEPLSDQLRPIRNLLDDFRKSMRFLIGKVEASPGLRLQMMQGFDEIVLFPDPGR